MPSLPVLPNAATTDDLTTPRPGATVGESWTALAAWAADELGVRLAFDGKAYRFEPADPAPPEENRSSSDSTIRRSWFRRRAPKEEASPETPVDDFTCESPSDVVLELVERLAARDTPPRARPIEQPTAVHDFAHRLFKAYTLDGGRAHLAGCHLEDTPLVRLTTLDASGEAPTVTHRYYDELGEPIEAGLAMRLGLDRVMPCGDPAPRLDAGRRERMLASARRREGDRQESLVTLVWAKRATGRLRFEFGDESLDAPFEGWAATLEAPPVVCPHTGVETFHLATTDEGVIAAAEAIAACQVSGERRLRSELRACTASGKLASSEHLGDCAASGEPVLKSTLTDCPRCGLSVSPTALHGGDCQACRSAERVTQDAIPWDAILTAHPGLAAHNWRIGQTAAAYVLESSGWLRRRVVTLDRETLGVLHAAEAARFSAVWRPVPKSRFDT